MQYFQALIGIIVFLALAWTLSENRQKISRSLIWKCLLIQVILAFAFLKIPFLNSIFLFFNSVLLEIEKATVAGTSFVFGYLGGGALPFQEPYPGASFILAFKALPLVLVMSVIVSILYYWGVIPWIVGGLSKVFKKVFKLNSAEAFAVTANIFVGMVEGPMFVKKYLNKLNRSELFTLMATGMATIAGTVLMLYASVLQNSIQNITGHLLIASVISIPASILFAKMVVPGEASDVNEELDAKGDNSTLLEAVNEGTTQGLSLLLSIVANLVVFVAGISLINSILGLFPFGEGALTLETLFGWFFAPIAWLLGIEWKDCIQAGSLMGLKTVLNEFIAFLSLSKLEAGAISEHSKMILTYALCGFANPGSVGIMIGGLSVLAPERKKDILSLAFKSLIVGTMSSFFTGLVIGLFY